MTHALINNTVSIFIVRVELCYLSSHAQREPLSLLLLATAASIIVAKPSVMLGPNWSKKGHIKLDNLIYRHSVSGPPVLKGITCEIKPSKKVDA